MKKGVKILMVLLAVAGMWSCNREEEHLNVDPTLLYGRWVQVDKPYYWTFNADGTGNLVNREAVQEGDADNGDFTWTLSDGDQSIQLLLFGHTFCFGAFLTYGLFGLSRDVFSVAATCFTVFGREILVVGAIVSIFYLMNTENCVESQVFHLSRN